MFMVFGVALLLVPFGVLASILFYVRFTLELTLDFSLIKLPKMRRENTSWVVLISAPQGKGAEGISPLPQIQFIQAHFEYPSCD